MKILLWMFSVSLLSSLQIHADDCISKTDNRSEKKGGILVEDLIINGPQTLDSNELAGITGTFAGSCFDDDRDELETRIKAEFQNRGFFAVQVDHVTVKPRDPLGSPKPVTIEAEVHEWLRFHLSSLSFVNNRAFTSAELSAGFPIHVRDRFERDKVASGLGRLRELYGTKGYLDMYALPNTTQGSNATVALTVELNEGKQYHMGKFEISGKKETADPLQAQWKLQEGALFDRTYIQKFVAENRALLGENFDLSRIQMARDCRDNTVAVRIILPGSSDVSSQSPDIDCDKKEDAAK
jgi:hypothetical protein